MRIRYVLIFFAFAAAISAISLFLGHGALYHYLNSAALIPRHESFTELYFDRPDRIPPAVAPGEPIEFSFAIHNLEDAGTTYPYVVYEVERGRRTTLSLGTVSVPAGSSVSTVKILPLPSFSSEIIVYVDLPLQNQEIHFRVHTDR